MHWLIYGLRAYRTELALFQAERVTATDAIPVAVPTGVEVLYRVIGRTDGTDLILMDWAEALAEVRTGGGSVHRIALAPDPFRDYEPQALQATAGAS